MIQRRTRIKAQSAARALPPTRPELHSADRFRANEQLSAIVERIRIGRQNDVAFRGAHRGVLDGVTHRHSLAITERQLRLRLSMGTKRNAHPGRDEAIVLKYDIENRIRLRRRWRNRFSQRLLVSAREIDDRDLVAETKKFFHQRVPKVALRIQTRIFKHVLDSLASTGLHPRVYRCADEAEIRAHIRHFVGHHIHITDVFDDGNGADIDLIGFMRIATYGETQPDVANARNKQKSTLMNIPSRSENRGFSRITSLHASQRRLATPSLDDQPDGRMSHTRYCLLATRAPIRFKADQ